jgi:N4-gp56 family major capsid protein
MAKTIFETSDALAKKTYDEKLFREQIKESYFSKFMGEGPKNLVHVKTELTKSKGDKINFGLRKRLAGAGVTGRTTLEGNEESLVTYQDDVALERYRHGVRVGGKLDQQRPAFSITDEAQAALADWGTEKIDALCFAALVASPTKNFYLNSSGVLTANASQATAKAGIHATNSLLTLNMISGIKASAKTGGNRSYIPIQPIKVGGKDYYVLLVHPDALYDLKVSTAYQTAKREAEARGSDHPLFTGAVGVWDGVVIHEHENCTVFTDGGGASVAGSYAHFMGAQSLVWAWGERPKTVMDVFDYEEEIGYAWGMTAGVIKPQFNSQDYGSLGVVLARTNISGL